MKKFITFLLTAILAVSSMSLFAGCSDGTKPYDGIVKVENAANEFINILKGIVL